MSKQVRQVLVILVMVALGLVVGYLIGAYLIPKEETSSGETVATWAKVLALACLPVWMFAVIAWHELGHVAAGLQVDFRFQMLTVGPFCWEKEGNQLRFRWNRDLNSFGGLALLLPDNEERLVPRFAWLVAGGPIASLLLALLAGIGWWLLPEGPDSAVGLYLLDTALMFLTLMSGGIALATMIPIHSGGFYSDGARVLRLLRGGEVARLEALMLSSIAESTAGVRPRDRQQERLSEAIRLAEAQKSPFLPYLQMYQYVFHLDLGDPDLAKPDLEKFAAQQDRMPPIMGQVLRAERAFWAAYFDKDGEAAAALRKGLSPSRFLPAAQLALIDAAIAQVRGDATAARDFARQAIAELDSLMDKGTAPLYQEWATSMM